MFVTTANLQLNYQLLSILCCHNVRCNVPVEICFSKGITNQLVEVVEHYPGPTHLHRSPQAHPWQEGVLWGKMPPITIYFFFFSNAFVVFYLPLKCENIICHVSLCFFFFLQFSVICNGLTALN